MATSDDFRGLADWWAGFEAPERAGEPAYSANFGWLPSPVQALPSLIPRPRGARDDTL
ncbi:hypothetical protein JOF41_005461 [Saccharothrix coeruleofusca]|uniref:hypothetical protein n=1 Tax=Saccharothrix coeruleofusca TaxID=33919 RepID=UPI001AE90815|nr:hypothetical protein [Saccharothrix coeruleofusca]MBP2339283.1 hypothetical protein [Saccharothrix coeruleofusca]